MLKFSMKIVKSNLYLFSLMQLVIFQLLITSEMEKELFENNPCEFNNLAIDTCDNQESLTFKTQAAQFLEYLCDNLDGFMR